MADNYNYDYHPYSIVNNIPVLITGMFASSIYLLLKLAENDRIVDVSDLNLLNQMQRSGLVNKEGKNYIVTDLGKALVIFVEKVCND